MRCHEMSCSVMEPVSAPAVCKALQPPCRSAVPDAPLPEERSPRAHNARPAARARPPARCGGAVPSTLDVMFCHEEAVRCHGMSCSPCAGIMFCGRSGHKAPVSDTSPGHVLRFARPCVFGMGLSFRALFVPSIPPPAPPCGGTLFRAYPAPARGRAFRGGAVRAPDCACARSREGEARTPGTPVPPPSQAFSAPTRTDAASGCRFLPTYMGKAFPWSMPNKEFLQK